MSDSLILSSGDQRKGCYENDGFSMQFGFHRHPWMYRDSGATRMVYRSPLGHARFAKVMPARASVFWREAYIQNAVELAA